MKEIKRRVDHHLPRWLHSEILTAVDFIWQVKDDDEKTQLISFDKLEGREVLYVLRIPEIKDEIKSFYEGVEDDELKTVELLIDELLKHLRSLSLRLEGDENAE